VVVITRIQLGEPKRLEFQPISGSAGSLGIRRRTWAQTGYGDLGHATLQDMTGVTGLLIKLGVRLVVFGLVFWIATRRNPKIVVSKKWALPLIALVFAVLNTGLYWVLKPILNLASLGAFGFVMPLVVNALLLVGTVKIFERRKWFEVQGVLATLWLAAFLTLAHGALYVGLDYLPTRF